MYAKIYENYYLTLVYDIILLNMKMIWWLIIVVNDTLNVPWHGDEFVLLYYFMFPNFREDSSWLYKPFPC